MIDYYESCGLCPRGCGVNRYLNTGVCGAGAELKCARAALHFWEEPCLSGSRGSGAVFFTGCPLHCVYCQNKAVSDAQNGKAITPERLSEIFLELQAQGAHNINLVTGVQYIPHIISALTHAKQNGLNIPIVYNSGGYEKTQTLKMLDGLIDIYLPDIKTLNELTARRYYHAPDYPQTALSAAEEMFRQTGAVQTDDDGIMKKGVIIRHLVLPNHTEEALDVIDAVYDRYGDNVYLSLMNQYTPMPHTEGFAELVRGVDESEYERVTDYAWGRGITRCFVQDSGSSGEAFIPEFDGTGV